MLAILLLSAAMAGGEPLDSLQEWVGTWTAARQYLTLTVEEGGHFRMDLDHKGERCFLEGTLLVRDGMVHFGNAEERQAHEAAAAQELERIEDLEAAALARERAVLREVGSKPKLEKKYARDGYQFVNVYGGSLDVDLPSDHPDIQALEAARSVVRHCVAGDASQPHHWPVLHTTPKMFFEADDRAVVMFPDHSGKDQMYRLVRPGAQPVMGVDGPLGGAWVAKLGAPHEVGQLWGQLLVEDEKLELQWEDGCTERARLRKTSLGFSFDEHSGSCDRLGNFRRLLHERGGIVHLRMNEAGVDLTLMREDGL